jgi:PIN domain nuclease of toxin-antitoxin system
MQYLLDTHVILWALDDDKRLSETVSRILRDPTSEKYVSIASAWEVAIKVVKGKLRLDGGVTEFFETVHQNEVELLPITEEHVKRLETLPLLHRDPFDRILIASALTEGMCLISADTNVQLYGITGMW